MKHSLRYILLGIVIIVVLCVLLARGDQLADLRLVAAGALTAPLLAAVVSQLGKYLAQSWAYHFCFKAVGERMRARNALPLVFGSFFMNTVAPSLNIAGATLVVDDARRRGIPVGKATSASLLMQITVDTGFLVIMLLGFANLQFTGRLSPQWALMGAVVACIILVMVMILYLACKKPEAVVRLLTPVERAVNRLLVAIRRNPLQPWARGVVESFVDAGRIVRHNPWPAIAAFACSVVASAFELTAFVLCGVAFGIEDPLVLVCGYVVATLVAMVTPVPQGVGFVEAAVVALFGAYGVLMGRGMAAVLCYRALVFWMPFFVGAVLINMTRTFRGEALREPVSDPDANLKERIVAARCAIPAGNEFIKGTAPGESAAVTPVGRTRE